MGLDVKEKALIIFVAKATVPLLIILGPLIAYTRLWENPIWLVGAATTATYAIKILRYLVEKLTRRRRNVLTYGKWAIVTGATSGIGEAFAHDLAKKGMNILIISRTAEKLEKVKSEIKAKAPGAEVEILTYDFTKLSEADAFYARLDKVATELHSKGGIGLLINNVGTNVETPEFLHELPEKDILDIVRVNVEGTVRMSRTILPYMAKRRSGGVINVSSGSGNHPTPLLSSYAATKAFINEFSRSLYHEGKAFNIDVLVVTPYYVTSNMYKKPPGVLNCSAERLVTDSLAVLGRYDIAFPYIAHAVLGNLMENYWATPQALFKSMSRTRARAMAKKSHSSSTQLNKMAGNTIAAAPGPHLAAA